MSKIGIYEQVRPVREHSADKASKSLWLRTDTRIGFHGCVLKMRDILSVVHIF